MDDQWAAPQAKYVGHPWKTLQLKKMKKQISKKAHFSTHELIISRKITHSRNKANEMKPKLK